MLRIGFLPSDFNPMLLMLGEQEDLRALGGVLRQFARDGATVRLHELAFCAAGRARVELTGDAGPAGLHATANAAGADAASAHAAGADAAGAFVWRLDAPRAAEFAELVDGLAAASRKAGSEMLECGIEEAAEIPVKVSRGEYTEAFLLC